MEPEDTPPMSGSNSICVATVLLDGGLVPMQEPVTELTLEAPGGLVRVRAECRDGKAERIFVQNLPSFAARLGVPLEVEGLGTLTVDTAYGGDSFVFVDPAALGLSLTADEAHDIARLGVRITAAANEALGFHHPENPDWRHISFCLFAGALERGPDGLRAKSAVAIRPGKVDRSPTGTALSARMAVLHARGEMAEGEQLTAVSLIGSTFTGRILGRTTVGEHPGDPARNLRPRLDHRDPPAYARPVRSVARGLPRVRHLGRALTDPIAAGLARLPAQPYPRAQPTGRSEMKLIHLLGATALAALPIAAATAQDAEVPPCENCADSMTISSWGGAYQAMQVNAYAQPYVEATGVNLIWDESSNEAVAKLRAQNEAGNVTWDLVDVLATDGIRLCDDGLAMEVPFDEWLAPAPDGTPASEDLGEYIVSDCHIPTNLYSTTFGYRTDVADWGGKVPEDICAIFDLETFPGKRALEKRPINNLEWALICSGVPVDQVYDTLETEEGVEKALAKLDTIKDQTRLVVGRRRDAAAPRRRRGGDRLDLQRPPVLGDRGAEGRRSPCSGTTRSSTSTASWCPPACPRTG